MTIEVRTHSFTVDDYHRMAEAGILGKHVELIEGEVIDMHPPRSHIFTADDYQRLGEVGSLHEDDRVELIEGRIVDRAAIGNRHLSAVDRLNSLLTVRLDGRAIIRVQGSIRLDNMSVPEPDLVVLRWRDDYYARKTADPSDVFLLIEVADTSLAWDRDFKAPLYAGAGIPEYWLVDLDASTITVFREAASDGYRSVATFASSDVMSPLAFPELKVSPDIVIL